MRNTRLIYRKPISDMYEITATTQLYDKWGWSTKFVDKLKFDWHVMILYFHHNI